MNSAGYFKSIMLLIGIIFLLLSCEYTELPKPDPPSLCESVEVTYANQIKPIIDRTCAFTGCHVTNSTAPGDFTNYESMEPFLNDIGFRRYVIEFESDPLVGMPPNWESNPGPKDLTKDELEIMECWISNDYPE